LQKVADCCEKFAGEIIWDEGFIGDKFIYEEFTVWSLRI